MGERLDSAASCCLCEEIATQEFPTAYRHAYPIDRRIVDVNRDCVLLPTLSPLTFGHVLVLPKQHVPSLSDLTGSLRESLLRSVQEVLHRLADKVSTPFYFFEHGARMPGTSCGIDHAHLHVVPLSAKTAGNVETLVEERFPAFFEGSVTEALELAGVRLGHSYLLHGSHLGSIRIAFDNAIPSQFMRQIVAGVQNLPEWNWRLLTSRDEFLSTYQWLAAGAAAYA